MERSVKILLLEGLNRFNGANLTLNSDVDQASLEKRWLGSKSHSDITATVYNRCKARNQPKSIYIYLTALFFFIAALSEASEKLTIRVTLVQEVGIDTMV